MNKINDEMIKQERYQFFLLIGKIERNILSFINETPKSLRQKIRTINNPLDVSLQIDSDKKTYYAECYFRNVKFNANNDVLMVCDGGDYKDKIDNSGNIINYPENVKISFWKLNMELLDLTKEFCFEPLAIKTDDPLKLISDL